MFSLAKFIALGAKSGISRDLLLNAICRHSVFLPSKMQEYLYFKNIPSVGIKITFEKTFITISKLQLENKTNVAEKLTQYTEFKLLLVLLIYYRNFYFLHAIFYIHEWVRCHPLLTRVILVFQARILYAQYKLN